MNFSTFLDSVYVATNLERVKTNSVYSHAKTLATKDLLDTQRTIFKFLAYFQVLGEFTLIKLGFRNAPKSAQVLFNEANADMLKKEVEPSIHAINQG